MTEKILYEQLGIGRTRELTGEIILTYREALTAINFILNAFRVKFPIIFNIIFNEGSFVILGGDVLSTSDEYIYAFWNYEIDLSLSPVENTHSSCEKALAYILSLKNKEMCNYILVLNSR